MNTTQGERIVHATDKNSQKLIRNRMFSLLLLGMFLVFFAL